MRYGRYLLALVVVAVVVTSVAFAWKNITPKAETSPTPSPEQITEVANPQTNIEASAPAQMEGSSFVLENPSVVVSDPMTNLITFEPDSAFNIKDKQGIMARIVEPYVLYQTEIQGTQKLTAIKISQNTQSNAQDYPFLFNATFDGGVTQGFVIERQSESFKWFVPECLGACPFSENFKTKYPEIVKLSEGV